MCRLKTCTHFWAGCCEEGASHHICATLTATNAPAERPRPDPRELLAGLGTEVPHAGVIEALGNRPARVLALPLDSLAVEGHVAGVADIVFHPNRP